MFLEEHGASNRGSNELSKKFILSWANSEASYLACWYIADPCFPMLRSIIFITNILWNVLRKFRYFNWLFYGDAYFANAMFENYKLVKRGKKPFIIAIFEILKFSFFANSHAIRLTLNMYSSTKGSAHWSAGIIVAPWFHESKIVPFGRFEVQRTPNRVLLVPMIACPQ